MTRLISAIVCVAFVLLFPALLEASVPQGIHNPSGIVYEENGEIFKEEVSITKLPDGSIAIIWQKEKLVSEDPLVWELVKTKRVDAIGSRLTFYVDGVFHASFNVTNVQGWIDSELGKAFDDGEFDTYPSGCFGRKTDQELADWMENNNAPLVTHGDPETIPNSALEVRMRYMLLEDGNGDKYVIARPEIVINGATFPLGPWAVVASEA